MTDPESTIRQQGEGESRWFFGGGLHTWKATAEETHGSFVCFEDHMAAGKMTPFHAHPDADEALYVIEGEIAVFADGEEHLVGPGGFAVALRGVPHAFRTTAETRMLCWHTSGAAESFFRHASEPTDDPGIDGPVDFARVQASAQEHGGVEILGPPPFAVTAPN